MVRGSREPNKKRSSGGGNTRLLRAPRIRYPGDIPSSGATAMRPFAALACLAVFASVSPAARAADDPAKVFEERILPIFKSPDPSSCVRCHLAAVDLKNYILPSAKDTFLALRDQGLIDLEKPENSKI